MNFIDNIKIDLEFIKDILMYIFNGFQPSKEEIEKENEEEKSLIENYFHDIYGYDAIDIGILKNGDTSFYILFLRINFSSIDDFKSHTSLLKSLSYEYIKNKIEYILRTQDPRFKLLERKRKFNRLIEKIN